MRELIVYTLALLIHFLNYIIMRLKFPLISKWRYVLTFPKKVGSEKRFVSMSDLEENAAPNFLFTDWKEDVSHSGPFVLTTIAFILSHILQCSGQQSWRQVIFIELQAKHQSSLGVVGGNDDDDMLFDTAYII